MRLSLFIHTPNLSSEREIMKRTAIAHPNIALIKYWGKRDIPLNLPSVPSLSLTLSKFYTETTVTWGAKRDRFVLNGLERDAEAKKVFQFLDIIDPKRPPCVVKSDNNFPTAAGLASSASAFAALALAGTAAAEKKYSIQELSVLARRGSGSACRSLWGGWVEWAKGNKSDGSDSHGSPLASPTHWDVRLVVAVVSDQKKPISSRKAMQYTARTSPFFSAWCDTAQVDLDIAKKAVLERDMKTLGEQMEHSTFKMFSTMFSAKPAIRFWKPQTLKIQELVEELRRNGTPCWATMDAGPNVKILCSADDAEKIVASIQDHCLATHILSAGSDAKLL